MKFGGIVCHKKTGEPLIGANVQVTLAFTTNINGMFSTDALIDEICVFASCNEYEPEIKALSDVSEDRHVTMKLKRKKLRKNVEKTYTKEQP